MSALFPVRKMCPSCGRPMKAVSGDGMQGEARYVCPQCDDDPLHDPALRKWTEGPLRPPSKWLDPDCPK
jgi:hypothetical protein